MSSIWPRVLLVACLTLAWHPTTAKASGGLPLALVFESSAYQSGLEASGLVDGLMELLPCDAPEHCTGLEAETLKRVVAVIGQAKDVSQLKRLPALRLVHSSSYMYTRLSDVPAQAIVASYQPDWRGVYGVEPIAEFVLAAVFDWNYRLRELNRTFAACAWGEDAPTGCPSTQQLTAHPVLMNQTMGVLGYGAIGQAVARRSAALGMRTVATKVHGPFSPPPPPLTWLSNNNDRLLRESDVVVVTVPGSVHGILNRTALQLMKPGALLIPVSAPPVDFDALYEALLHRRIGGAVLDVWPSGCWHFPDMLCGPPYGTAAEPYAGGQIQRLDNVLVLPGMAMRDDKFWAGSEEWVAGNLRALAKGLPLRGVVRNGTSSRLPGLAQRKEHVV